MVIAEFDIERPVEVSFGRKKDPRRKENQAKVILELKDSPKEGITEREQSSAPVEVKPYPL